MPFTPDQIDDAAVAFLDGRHLATFVSQRADGSPHAVPVAFTWDREDRCARIVAPEGTVKVRNADRGGTVLLSFVEGGKWMTLEGRGVVSRDPARVAVTIDRYLAAYGGRAGHRPDPSTTVSLELHVQRWFGRVSL